MHVEAARKGRPDVSPEVSAVLEKGLAADPGLRFASATAFAQALARARREPGRRAAPKVFFSYQRESSAGFADLFQAKIQDQEGIDIYLDTTRRDGTGPFPARLAKIIQDCDVFVCFLAGSTLASRYVREEIRLAHQAGKPMIPVFHEDFNPAPVEPDHDPAVEALIAYEGVHLLSRRNIHVDHTISRPGAPDHQHVRQPGKIRLVRLHAAERCKRTWSRSEAEPAATDVLWAV